MFLFFQGCPRISNSVTKNPLPKSHEKSSLLLTWWVMWRSRYILNISLTPSRFWWWVTSLSRKAWNAPTTVDFISFTSSAPPPRPRPLTPKIREKSGKMTKNAMIEQYGVNLVIKIAKYETVIRNCGQNHGHMTSKYYVIWPAGCGGDGGLGGVVHFYTWRTTPVSSYIGAHTWIDTRTWFYLL